MTDTRRLINLEGYLRQYRQVLNDSGGRGYNQGIRTFDCPLCGDSKGRGWIALEHWGAGCFNAGCPAEPKLEGGAVEWIRRVEGFPSRGDVWRKLLGQWRVSTPIEYKALAVSHGPDFCRLPRESRSFITDSLLQKPFERFIKRQWGLGLREIREWNLRWCHYGKYGNRVIIPIVMNQELVAFQARTIGDGFSKYLTSQHGPESDPNADCARPAASLLFNLDAASLESEIMLVEGPGDVMGWHRDSRTRTPIAVGLLGVALTPEKLAMIAALSPERVIIALDAEPVAQQRAWQHLDDISAWGMNACFGLWKGGKDAGSGATLEITEPDSSTAAAVRARLGI